MTSNTPIFPSSTLPLELRIRFLWNRMVRFATLSEDVDAGSAYEAEREFKKLIDIENATISRICFSYSNSIDEFEDLRQNALINI